MKKKLPLLLSAFIFFSINNCTFANETEIIDLLIETTGKQLEKQRELKELMVSYKYQCDLFEKGQQSKGHVFRLVTTAERLLTKITENHLHHLFPLNI